MIGLQECGPAPPRAPISSSRSRTAQSVDYYNTQVKRAWLNASNARSSFNDRHHHQSTPRRPQHLAPEQLYRSNSSLELLDHNGRPSNTSSPVLKREYGSHGSIDVIARPDPVPGTGEAFFALLQDYPVFNSDQRSPAPSEYLRGKIEISLDNGNALIVDETGSSNCLTPHSPKLLNKLRFWGNTSVNGVNIKQQRQAMDDSVVNISSSSSSVPATAESEEIARRRAFTHFDCQSLRTNLFFVVRLRRNLLAKRRNTTTGASAASMVVRSTTPDGENGEEDEGDGQFNELVESCPFFRNEIGGEEERIVSLTRLPSGQHVGAIKPLHRPPLAYGVAILEFPPGETHWRHSTCPYQRLPRPIESVDQGALYYRTYFFGQEHQNWFGMDEQLGPVAISIRREKVVHPEKQQHSTSALMQYQYRLVVRTSELQTLRGAILEDAIPNIKASSSSKTMNTKEVLEYVAPEVQLSSLRLGIQNHQTEEQLLKLDEQGLMNCYKVGIMYCKEGQSSEEEMYNNEEAGPAFTEFLETIGKKVRLNGFNKYKAGLDNKTDSTGQYSVYAQYQDCEIMFHVSTMLPFTPNNRQQLLRKRHIGNDIVTIVFQEPGALPFTPRGIRSQFQHVFIIVQAIKPCTENTFYKVAVSRSKDVQVFGPPIKKGGIYPKGKAFAEFLLGKVVNAENAAHRSEKFVTMATRTRQEYLKDLVSNFSTSTPVDTGQKFSIFSSKKKDKIRPRFIPDACQRGAILWQVLLDDNSRQQQQKTECFLGISADSLVLIEENTKQIVFVSPCKSILGWSPDTGSLRIYHHQGECMIIHMRDSQGDRDELMEIMDRLKHVTQGALAQELSLNRNMMGQLGFHVQPDGTVTLVENNGQAWHAGLRQNSRLVEICKIAVATLTYDKMVDLLKTSSPVTLTVIPPLSDGSPRKGCTLQNCKYNEGNYEGDYENLGSDEVKTKVAAQRQHAVPGGHHRKLYDRSFSPPRSSNSSGYGTGSSSKSFHGQESRFPANQEGTMTSSSSGHSSDDKWYDFLPDDALPSKHPNRTNEANTFPSTPKRNNSHQITQLQISQSHNHFPQQVQHTKVQVSHSLPLQHVNYSQPLTASIHNNSSEYDLAYKLEKNNIVKQQNERMRQENDYMLTRAPKVAEYSTIQHLNNDYNRLNINNADSHSTDSSLSERLFIGSEDELSNGSGNISPRTRRANKHLTPTNNCSRNQSPRSMNGEAKLRPGVTSRSSNRNSANLSTSNLQEELLRLINPDTIQPPAVEPKLISKESVTSRSRENLNNNQLTVHKTAPPEVILTMARPATVISNASTTSSPLPNEFKNFKEDLKVSPHISSKQNLGLPEDFPLPEDSDWSSLVHTATKHDAMMQVSMNTDNYMTNENDRARHWEDEGTIDASLTSSVSSSTSVPELQSHISELEARVNRETRRRLSLESENRHLKEQNKKLQEEVDAAVQKSQAAVRQLRKFTEWFFKNVERK